MNQRFNETMYNTILGYNVYTGILGNKLRMCLVIYRSHRAGFHVTSNKRIDAFFFIRQKVGA